MVPDFLDTDITYMKGVGPKRAEIFKKEFGILPSEVMKKKKWRLFQTVIFATCFSISLTDMLTAVASIRWRN